MGVLGVIRYLLILQPTLGLLPSFNDQLGEARRRAKAPVRTHFASVVNSPEPKLLDLVGLIAAEDDQSTLESLSLELDGLAELANQRLGLERLFSSEVPPISVCEAVSATLFGRAEAAPRGDAGDAAPRGDAGEATTRYFRGNSEDYYDPENSLLGAVLARRAGNPIALSVVFAEVCERAGLPLVGINAPGHVLLAPAAHLERPDADPLAEFAVDAFEGRVLRRAGGELEAFVAVKAGELVGGKKLKPGSPAARALLKDLPARVMSPRAWAARVLRNLRVIHAREGDVVRLLGTVERLRLIGAAEPDASPSSEQYVCGYDLARCVLLLRDDERRGEARGVLRGVQRSLEMNLAPPEAGNLSSGAFFAQLERLLAEPWLNEDGPTTPRSSTTTRR